MKQLNNGNWLAQDEAQSLSDELYYQDAIQAYIQTLPLLNTISLRDGSEAVFGKGYNVLPIWKERMDSRAVVPTPNSDVIYSMSYLDLKETGPLVIKAPPNVIGMFTDFFQKTITDVGANVIPRIQMDNTQKIGRLPAPEGNLSLYIRVYWGEQSILDGSWQPPKIEIVK